jgi:aspartate carbamoyltransferase regulatory subunit
MPATREVACENDDCELDMFEVHYTYDVPDDHGVADLRCPYCGEGTHLEEIVL